MNRPAWIDDLEALAARFGGYLGQDLALMTLTELWAAYTFLSAYFAQRG